jgi:hypothetical protein
MGAAKFFVKPEAYGGGKKDREEGNVEWQAETNGGV